MIKHLHILRSPVRMLAGLRAGFLTLPFLLQMARENNPDLRAARAAWMAAEADVSAAVSLPDPSVSYSHMAGGLFSGDGPTEDSLEVAQTFPWFGKRGLRKAAAGSAAEVERVTYAEQIAQVEKEVKKAFYEYILLRDRITFNRSHMELLKATESVALARFRAGKLPQSNLIQIQIEQGKLEVEAESLEGERMPISARLAKLTGITNALPLEWPAENTTPEPYPIDTVALAQRLQRDNPSRLRLGHLLEAEESKLNLIKKDALPDVTLGVEHTRMRDSENATAFMVSMNLPIRRGRRRAERAATDERMQSLVAQMEASDRATQADFETLSYNYRDSANRAEAYRDTLIPKARQAVEVALKGFETGNVPFADLMEAERALLNLRLESARQQAQARIWAAELEALVVNMDLAKMVK